MIRHVGDPSRGLIAAYREGLGLAAVAIVCGPAGVRIIAAPGDGGLATAAEDLRARWWCRRAADAARLAAAARRSLRRESSAAAMAAAGGGSGDSALSCARAAVLGAAEELGIALQSDQETDAQAMNVAARIEAEMHKQQECGGMKSVNKAYRAYRLAASERDERALRYHECLSKYRESLVRQAAFALR
jgi:hypothetical protein